MTTPQQLLLQEQTPRKKHDTQADEYRRNIEWGKRLSKWDKGHKWKIAFVRSIGFLGRIDYQESTGCWNWTGSMRGFYGSACFFGKMVAVHRISAHLYLGLPLDSPLHVLHRCDNPLCFNPKHLYIGTHQDNMRDRDSKGRHYLMKRTHCPRGHEYTKENTYLDSRTPPHRQCRICRKMHSDAGHVKEREARLAARQKQRMADGILHTKYRLVESF